MAGFNIGDLVIVDAKTSMTARGGVGKGGESTLVISSTRLLALGNADCP